MKVEIIETFNFPPEIIFAVLSDIPHHINWVEGVIEFINLTNSPAKLGTKWEQLCDLLGRRLVISNECNVYEINQQFGWVTEKPIATQTTVSLAPEQGSTQLTWKVESQAIGVAQLAEPLLVKETRGQIQKSLGALKVRLLQMQVESIGF